MRQSSSRISRTGAITGAVALLMSMSLAALAPSAFADATAPDAPTSVSVTAGNASLSVSWTAPSDNGSSITSYTVNADDGVDTPSSCATDGTTTTCLISGLTNGTEYGVTVNATNAVGTSDPSTSVAGTPAAQVPSTVTGVLVTSGNASASVSWSAPANNGATI